MEKPQWRVRRSSYVVESEYLRLRKDEIELPEAERTTEFYVRESDGFVIVFPLTRSGDVIVVHQYRYGIDRVTLELPAGTLDDGESAADCANRELAEETGYTSARLEPLLTAPSDPVRSNSMMHAFIAYDCERTQEQDLDEGEIVEYDVIPIAEIERRLRAGDFGAVPSVAVTYAALEKLGHFTHPPASP